MKSKKVVALAMKKQNLWFIELILNHLYYSISATSILFAQHLQFFFVVSSSKAISYNSHTTTTVFVCMPETTQNMSIAFIIFIVAQLYAFPAFFRHLYFFFLFTSTFFPHTNISLGEAVDSHRLRERKMLALSYTFFVIINYSSNSFVSVTV